MKLKVLFIALIAPFVLLQCGDDGDGDSLDAQIVPGESLILPGEGRSCADIEQELLTGTSEGSIGEFRFFFPSFRLRWTSTTEDLFVAEIRFSVPDTDQNIGGFSQSISGDELDLLLGIENGRVPAADSSVSCDGGNISGCREIVSNDTSTKSGTSVSCGVSLGGISLPDDEEARFVSTLEVRVIGFSVNLEDNSQRPARSNFSVTLRRE